MMVLAWFGFYSITIIQTPTHTFFMNMLPLFLFFIGSALKILYKLFFFLISFKGQEQINLKIIAFFILH